MVCACVYTRVSVHVCMHVLCVVCAYAACSEEYMYMRMLCMRL